jgi:transcriptional regulator with XRE-family HTH domain
MPTFVRRHALATPSNEADAAFGERVRAMRKGAGRTLEDLSAASGLSRASLSKIERGEMSPTYDSLLKLARGLGTDVATLVSGRRPVGGTYDVTRAGNGAEHRADKRFVTRLLAPNLHQRALYAFITEVRAVPLEKYGRWDRHDTEDFLYVLDGALAVHLADRPPIELREGDSLQMDGRIPHALTALPSGARRVSKPVAHLLWVSVPFA